MQQNFYFNGFSLDNERIYFFCNATVQNLTSLWFCKWIMSVHYLPFWYQFFPGSDAQFLSRNVKTFFAIPSNSISKFHHFPWSLPSVSHECQKYCYTFDHKIWSTLFRCCPQASFHQIHAVCVISLKIWRRICSILTKLIYVISVFGCPPKLDTWDRCPICLTPLHTTDAAPT